MQDYYTNLGAFERRASDFLNRKAVNALREISQGAFGKSYSRAVRKAWMDGDSVCNLTEFSFDYRINRATVDQMYSAVATYCSRWDMRFPVTIEKCNGFLKLSILLKHTGLRCLKVDEVADEIKSFASYTATRLFPQYLEPGHAFIFDALITPARYPQFFDTKIDKSSGSSSLVATAARLNDGLQLESSQIVGLLSDQEIYHLGYAGRTLAINGYRLEHGIMLKMGTRFVIGHIRNTLNISDKACEQLRGILKEVFEPDENYVFLNIPAY